MARKTTTRRNTRTPEERREQAAQIHATIATQVETLVSTEGWQRYLDAMTGFHNYSLNNLMLIMAQRPDTAQVAGYQKWREKGRQVVKGSKSIKIFGYSYRVVEDEDAEGGKKKIPFFPILHVYAREDTAPIEGYVEPESPISHVEGADDAGVFAIVSEWLTGLGWTVTREPVFGNANGYATIDGTNKIVVDANLGDAMAVKTLLHETGHALLHTTDDGQKLSRDVQEVEAESVAYVTAGMLGTDTSCYSIGYVSNWSDGNTEMIRQTAERVLGAVHTISSILEPQEAAIA